MAGHDDNARSELHDSLSPQASSSSSSERSTSIIELVGKTPEDKKIDQTIQEVEAY
ncbi:hypothetical protein [Rickettsiales endosymbiont of Stachyamoeba lipophora]|uniref:hypothetical protein n=1 Tax=Rickettsiales endosymbiont of Stachyamoeba lipophora TaxID=2486578 RepID=UPI0013DDBE69|nr:hypothetical protein [Rickettsiales endosymbiont of Stachyamoeba lipophora]